MSAWGPPVAFAIEKKQPCVTFLLPDVDGSAFRGGFIYVAVLALVLTPRAPGPPGIVKLPVLLRE